MTIRYVEKGSVLNLYETIFTGLKDTNVGDSFAYVEVLLVSKKGCIVRCSQTRKVYDSELGKEVEVVVQEVRYLASYRTTEVEVQKGDKKITLHFRCYDIDYGWNYGHVQFVISSPSLHPIGVEYLSPNASTLLRRTA